MKMKEVTLLDNNLPDPSAEQQGLFEIHVMEPGTLIIYKVDYYTTHRRGVHLMFMSNSQVHKCPIASVHLIKKNFDGPLKVNRIEK